MNKDLYGFWDSPIDPGVFSSIPLAQELHVSAFDVFWTESRPLEKGRHALVNSSLKELFPSMSVQSRVHEYGGGAFFVSDDLCVFFDAFSCSLYLKREKEELICLVQDPMKRWADFALSPDRKLVACVCEDHSFLQVKNSIVVIDLEVKTSQIIHEQYDFYASPRFSPDGLELAFIYWNFPFMPWEESSLEILSYPSLEKVSQIGGAQESVAQFIWLGPKEILFASDRNGFWNLYQSFEGFQSLLCEKKADFASPIWVLGRKNFELFVLNGQKTVVCFFTEKGVDSLAFLHLQTKTLEVLDLPFTTIRSLDLNNEFIYFIGGNFQYPLSVIQMDIVTRKIKVISSTPTSVLQYSSFIAIPQKVSTQSSIDGKSVFGFLYEPKNPNYRIEEGILPPLIIKCHSGPTSHVPALFNGEVQFWTSRGFAWLDVNYRGSSGFGRDYREALRSLWGFLDVRDCLDLMLDLVAKSKVDRNRVFAKGSSSGGLTALCLTAAFPYLRGCVSYYGVTDLELLRKETHKFERFYLDSLLGSYKDFATIYKERSPCAQTDFIVCPVLLFHGDQDRVVALSQAEEFVDKMPLAKLFVLHGEGHGFKNGATLIQCAEKELFFFQEGSSF